MGVMQVDFQVAKIWDFNFPFPFRMGKSFQNLKFSWVRKKVSHTALVNGGVTINFTVPWIRL